MTPLPPNRRTRTRVAKLVVTLVAGIATILWINTAQDGADETAQAVSASALLTLPGDADPTATPIATTAPLQLPTPTATAVPTSTPAPTATPSPVPTSTAVPTAAPTATAVPAPADGERGDRAADEPSVSVADAGAVAPTAAPEPTAVPEPTATLAPAPTATPAPVAAGPEPTPTVIGGFVVAPEPTAEATVEATPIPTATPEPVVGSTVADLEIFVLGELNKVRANAGLGPLALDPAATEIARDWSTQMATGGFFSHRPAAQLNTMLPANWRQWGENIASAPDIFWAQSSLETSPGHYQNMVGPFTHVGVGVYSTGSQVWLTQVFVRYG